MKWEQAASTAMFLFPNSISDVILKRKKKIKNYRTTKLINFVKVIWNICFSLKRFKALISPCWGLGKRLLTWEKPLHFSGLLIFPPPPANPLLQPVLRYFTERAGAGARSPAHREAAVGAARPAPGNPGYPPNAWKRRPTALGSKLPPLHPVQAALEELSSFALYFQSRSLLAARLCTQRSHRFAPSFYN